MMNRSRGTWLSMTVVAAVGWMCGVTWASAQGLAETARQEEARRKTITKPAKVYTNRSLRTDVSEAGVPAPATTSESGADVPSAPAPPAAEAAAPPDPRKTPDYWKKRMTEALQERDNNALMLEALESRVNGLWADFTARDNPLERATIAENRQKALDELARRKTLAETLKKAVNDLEDEARKAGVPPGWLR